MKRFFAVLEAVGAAAIAVGIVFHGVVWAQPRQDENRHPRGSVRPEAKSPPARSGASRGPVPSSTMSEWRSTVVPYVVYPYGVYTYGVYPYPVYGYPYAAFSGNFPNGPGYTVLYPYAGYPYSAPVYPSPQIFGVPGPSTDPAVPPSRPEREERPAAQRGTNRDSLALAGKFIGYGDNHFAAQRYNEANQRYKTAAGVAPGLAEACFRQGFALTAMGRYELAIKAFKRGLDLDPAWAASGFRIDTLYRDNEMAKKSHLDALAKATSGEQLDPDMLFLLGVLLYFDGQSERAAPFFQRANQLANSPYLTGFLAQLKKE